MKRCSAVLAAIAVTTTTVAASAHDRCRRIDTDIFECSPEPENDDVEPAPRLNENGSIDVRFGFVSFAPLVADKRFNGSGTPVGGTGTASFSATGKELGFVRPRAYGGEVDVAYLRRWIRFGGFFGVSELSPDANATSYAAASTVNGGSLWMMHAGLDAALILPIDRVRLGVGAAFGGYFLSLPLLGFEKTKCGAHYCNEQATTTIGFAQPRLSFDVELGADDAPITASLGGFVGVDVANEHSTAWGITLSIHEPQHQLAL